jgi:hypothetical protein
MSGGGKEIVFARLSGDRGVHWLKVAFAMLSKARMPWLLMLLFYYVILVAINIIPVLGQLAAPILKPIFAVGFLAAAWSQERGGTPHLVQLFAGFRSNLWALLPLGVVLLVGVTIAVMGTALIDDGKLLDALSGRTPFDETLIADDRIEAAMLFSVACALPVMLALWFAPALVVFQDCTAWRALGVSFRAALANWRPIAVYGLVVFFAGGVVPGLILELVALLVPASFAYKIAIIVLMPYMALFIATLHISDYVSYREIFHAGETPAVATAPPAAPADSP